MKKLFFMAVAAMAALSSCTSDNDLELNQNTGKEALTFTATMEDNEATRATFDNTNLYAAWDEGDQICINGKSYSAQEGASATSTFKATTAGQEAKGPTYTAYFPAYLYDNTDAILPPVQAYEAGKFNMPMYATSTSTELQFYNLCAVLAIKVTSADITTLKSIKVASDKKMSGKFTVTDNTAVINDDKGTNVVVLESSEALTLTETGTTFYIAIPAQEYKFLNIFLSADGTTYTQAMATKKADGLSIARNTIFNIDYAKNATKLWAGNLFIADYNVGAKSPEEYGGLYCWGGSTDKDPMTNFKEGTAPLSGTDDTATKFWGINWRMLTSDELATLSGLGTWDDTKKGLLCTSTVYSSNSVFLPAAGCYVENESIGQGSYGRYTSSTPDGPNSAKCLFVKSDTPEVLKVGRESGCSVRAVLEEEESPATTGKAFATIGGSNVEVNWVQLWAGGPKFAEYNVGVTDGKAESFGGYYFWGKSVDKDPKAVYNTDQVTLTGTDDTATNLWGSKWRMPTKEEFEKLRDNCTVQWVTNYKNTGVNGNLLTGKGAYASNSIFFPATAVFVNGAVKTEEWWYGNYWSSTPGNSSNAWYFHARNTYLSVSTLARNIHGLSIRAVLKE